MPIQILKGVSMALASEGMHKHIKQMADQRTKAPYEGGRWLPELLQHQMLLGLQSAQLYDITNVYGWLRTQILDEGSALEGLSNLPRCIPPFPYTYLEWTDEDGDRMAAFCVYSGEKATKSNPELAEDLAEEGAASVVMITPFLRYQSHIVALGSAYLKMTPSGQAILEVGRDKVMRGVAAMRTLDLAESLERAQQEFEEGYNWLDGSLGRSVWAVAFTYSLLNCRNVRTIQRNSLDDLSRQARRHAERRKEPAILYKELEVSPLKPRYAGEEGERPEPISRRRLHVVAGHFAEYGPEFGKGKLFGKLEGVYFIPDHVRGSLEDGVVAKTYKVRAPRKQDVTPEALVTLGIGG